MLEQKEAIEEVAVYSCGLTRDCLQGGGCTCVAAQVMGQLLLGVTSLEALPQREEQLGPVQSDSVEALYTPRWLIP